MLELRGVTRQFGQFTALDKVHFTVHSGEVVGLLGENGAGKSTLMNLVGGVLRPSSGQILLDGKTLQLSSPRQATALGIGVVHQHFMLVPGFTVAENVALHTDKNARIFNAAIWQKRIAEWAGKLGWKIDGSRLVEDLSVGERQRVEILKALFGSTAGDGQMARLLLLDEPTANLTPQETTELFGVLRRLRDRGCGIIFVSHKLQEVLSLCNRVVVLQHGKITGEREASQTNSSELARLMVGRDVDLMDEATSEKTTVPERSRRDFPHRFGSAQRTASETFLDINNLQSGILKKFSMQVNAGEIVGLAGVDGNGQRDLFEALAGLTKPRSGAIKILSGHSPAFIPPDRGTEGLIPIFDISENLALNGTLRRRAKSTFWFKWELIQDEARRAMEDFDVRAPQSKERTPAGQLSGGNQQKVVLARALRFGAKLVVAMDPARGLDVAAAAFVHEQLRAAAAAGTAILLISTDLDEIIALSDRIGVLYEGELLPGTELLKRGADRQIIGELMGGKNTQNSSGGRPPCLLK